MIDRIRRRFARSIDQDPWDTEQEFEPEAEAEETEASRLSADTHTAPPSITNDVNSGEYHRSIVKTAIENGGRYGGHQIPVPWLRMILAGLEWRYIDPETMWYGFEASALSGESRLEIPSYEDLFPTEPGAAVRSPAV